ncbi:unnamed protein product [Dovyalis caffra]|uniref:Uncharacterized protein n=1 Tax=Dovyalis caffra TaxID=77055 RepID=A0AAV1QVL0_9ROSI|nr:unnamed protein product [Dovyalis caffra]
MRRPTPNIPSKPTTSKLSHSHSRLSHRKLKSRTLGLSLSHSSHESRLSASHRLICLTSHDDNESESSSRVPDFRSCELRTPILFRVFLRFDFVSGLIIRVSVVFAQTQGPLNFVVEDNVYRAIPEGTGGIKSITNYSSLGYQFKDLSQLRVDLMLGPGSQA